MNSFKPADSPVPRIPSILEKQYFSSQAIVGRITSLALLARAVLKNPADRWGIVRFALAAQKVFYWTLRKADAESHGFKPHARGHPGTWEDLCSGWLLPTNLLTGAEADLLGAYRGNRCNALFAMLERDLRLLVRPPAPHGGAGDGPEGRADDSDEASMLRTGIERADFLGAMVEHALAITGRMASISEASRPAPSPRFRRRAAAAARHPRAVARLGSPGEVPPIDVPSQGKPDSATPDTESFLAEVAGSPRLHSAHTLAQ